MSIFNKLENKIDYPLQQKIAAELVQFLYSKAKYGIIGTMVVATFFVYALHNIEPTGALNIWYLVMAFIAVLRYAIIKIYYKIKPPPEKTFYWKTIFIVMTSCAGITWSFAGTLLIPSNALYQFFVACSLAGVAAGAVPYFSGSRLACASFVIPVLLPFAVWLLWHGNRPYTLLGFLTLFYTALLLISSFRTHRTIYNTIRLKFENDDLVLNLSSANKEVEVMNQELRNEINERKIIEKLLRDSEEQYRLVTNALPVLISYIDTQLYYRFNNKAHEEWFGIPLAQITGKPIKDIIDQTTFSIFMEYYEELQTKKQINYETIMHFKENEERYVSITLIPHLKEGKMYGFFSLISDITPRINYLATHDSLTDLPNRGLFNAKFNQALKRANQNQHNVVLLFLDLDYFKNVNDTLGHDAGDQLLVKVVKRIKTYLRDSDTLARFGGDEFAIILESITTNQLLTLADVLQRSFTMPFHISNREVFITVSVGITLYPDDGDDAQILLKNADMALYRAKEKGRNRVEFYTRELNQIILKKHTISNYLHSALEKNEFCIYYQPIINIADTKICGLQALLRWNNTELGFVPPNEFIPIAEEIGLIVPIGEWVMRTACAQNYQWKKHGNLPPYGRLAINLSARQFREKNLVEKIATILQQTHLEGKHLTLELTESLIMQDMDYNTKAIKALKELGITISIDDFGTGYSSLSYLRRFPVDMIKIDRSFICEVGINSTDAAIVRAIIIMAHSLKMKVVAEGVETIDQYNLLKNVGCDEIQGFLISTPIPFNEIENVLHTPDYIEQQLKLAQIKTPPETTTIV